jgi:transglutaminase/protease-like cytokinesis protein 3
MRKGILLSIVFLVVTLASSACGGKVTETTAPSAAETVVIDLKVTEVPATETASPTAEPTLTATAEEPTEPLAYNNPQKYQVTYTVTIKNDGFNPNDIRLYLPLAGSYDAQKDLEIVSISPAPTRQEIEPLSGNAMVYWQLKGTPAKGSSTKLEEQFTFTAYETNTAIDPATVKPYDTKSDDYKRYTQPEKYIESTDPQVVQLADQIAGSETNPYLLAKMFYDYIIDNEHYKILDKGLNGAKFLLTNKKGECGDYSSLFIALARAKGIPARPVVGYWAISGIDQTHVWAEFYLEGVGWIPVDATIGQQSAKKRAYYFGNMDNQRVILSKEFNTPLVPVAPDNFKAPILQVPLYWFWGSGSDQQISFNRNWTVTNLP